MQTVSLQGSDGLTNGELKQRIQFFPVIDSEKENRIFKKFAKELVDEAKKDYPKQVLVSDEGVEHTWFSDETHQQHISKWFEKWFGENE